MEHFFPTKPVPSEVGMGTGSPQKLRQTKRLLMLPFLTARRNARAHADTIAYAS
jgi:hypothetical protein